MALWLHAHARLHCKVHMPRQRFVPSWLQDRLQLSGANTHHSNNTTTNRAHYLIKNYRCCTGGPLSIMGDNSSCMFPVCSAQIWHEIWHPCNFLIYREKLNLYAKRLTYREKESLYAERNGYYLYCNNVKKIILRASICIFSSYYCS